MLFLDTKEIEHELRHLPCTQSIPVLSLALPMVSQAPLGVKPKYRGKSKPRAPQDKCPVTVLSPQPSVNKKF